MKAHELAKTLLEGPNVDVLFEGPNGGEGPYAVTTAFPRIAEENEYPEEYDMPAGFNFILLG